MMDTATNDTTVVTAQAATRAAASASSATNDGAHGRVFTELLQRARRDSRAREWRDNRDRTPGSTAATATPQPPTATPKASATALAQPGAATAPGGAGTQRRAATPSVEIDAAATATRAPRGAERPTTANSMDPKARVEQALALVELLARTMAERDAREVRLRLDPEHLGPVTLRMRHEGARLVVHLAATTPEAVAVLGRDAQGLRQRLRALGFDEIELKIAIEHPADGDDGQEGASNPA